MITVRFYRHLLTLLERLAQVRQTSLTRFCILRLDSKGLTFPKCTKCVHEKLMGLLFLKLMNSAAGPGV